MNKTAINPAVYQRLIRFAAKGGSVSMIGNAIGDLDLSVIRSYLGHMKITDNTLYNKWGSKWAPPAEDEPDLGMDSTDDFNPLDDTPAPLARKKTVVPARTPGLDALLPTCREEDEPPPPGTAKVKIDGTAYPETFKLRKEDGTTIPLEVFSKSDKFGFYLRIPVPQDIRTITIKGKSVEIDLLALHRDPDGITNGVENSKLIAVAEIQ